MFAKKNSTIKSLIFVLIISMLVSMVGGTSWNQIDAYASTEAEINSAVENTIEAYFKQNKQGVINDFYELAALTASGENIEDYKLELSYNSTSSAIIGNLIVGKLSEAEQLATQLISGDELITEGDAFKDALNIIAIEGYNRTVNEEDKLSYNKESTINNLLSHSVEGQFQDPYNQQPSSEYAGMALVALSMFKGNEAVDNAIASAIEQIKETQHSDGAFEGAWGSGAVDANTTATVIWGIIAADKEHFSSYVTESEMTPTDGLLSFLLSEGGYGFNDNSSLNGYATKQAALAMADIKNEKTFFSTFIGSPITYESIECQTITEDGSYLESKLTIGADKSVEKAIQRNLKDDSAIDFSKYNIYINGELEEEPASKILKEGDAVLAVSNNYSKVAYFKTNPEDLLGVNKATIDFEGSIELTLIEKNLLTGEEKALANNLIGCGTAVASNFNRTDNEGKVTITPVEAITYDVMALNISEDTAVLPAKITMKSGDVQTADVKLRVEGPSSNILNAAFAVARSDGSRLTVYDAVTQGLERMAIPYVDSNKYITSINNIEAGLLGSESTWDGWSYTFTDLEHLNGTKSTGGMSGQFINDGDEIVVYYGNDSATTVYPILNTTLNSDGSVTVKIENYATDWTSGTTSLIPTEGVKLAWGYTSGSALIYEIMTDSEGKAAIPKEYAAIGSHSLQIEKNTEGLPDVVRLAPNYTVEIKEDSIGDDGNVVDIEKAYITVKGPSNNLKSRTGYSWYKGMTAMDILKLTDLNMKIKDNYVEEIEGYGEFTLGKNSGWLYSVNGVTPPTTAARDYTLASGDEVLWYYTKDYTKDKSSSAWKEETKIEEEENTAISSMTVQIKMDKEGLVNAETNVKDISEAIETAIEAAKKTGKELKEVKIVIDTDENVRTVATVIPQASVTELNRKVDAVSINTPIGNVLIDKETLATISKSAVGDVTITMGKKEKSKVDNLSEFAQKAIGERNIYEFNISSKDKEITKFNGNVEITLPYKADNNEDINAIVVGYINKDGNIEIVNKTNYDADNEEIKFYTNHFSQYGIAYIENNLTDIKKHWANNQITYLAARGIVNGINDETFAPNNNITRAEFVQILANLSNVNLEDYKGSVFKDVKSNAWYAKSISWAAENGLITGIEYKDGTKAFNPKANITRQDMAVILLRYMSKIEKNQLKQANKEVEFADKTQISSYAEKAVSELQKAGVINGKTNNKFEPKNNATRAETAKMIYVLMKSNI